MPELPKPPSLTRGERDGAADSLEPVEADDAAVDLTSSVSESRLPAVPPIVTEEAKPVPERKPPQVKVTIPEDPDAPRDVPAPKIEVGVSEFRPGYFAPSTNTSPKEIGDVRPGLVTLEESLSELPAAFGDTVELRLPPTDHTVSKDSRTSVDTAPVDTETTPVAALNTKAADTTAEFSAAAETSTGEVDDSLDEILERSSEQTLRLAHLTDELDEVRASITALRSHVESGLGEARSDSQAAHDRSVSFGDVRAELEARIDRLERRLGRGRRLRTALLLIVLGGVGAVGYELWRQRTEAVVSTPPDETHVQSPVEKAEPVDEIVEEGEPPVTPEGKPVPLGSPGQEERLGAPNASDSVKPLVKKRRKKRRRAGFERYPPAD